MKINWNFLGGGRGMQNKKPSVGEYGYFLELHYLTGTHPCHDDSQISYCQYTLLVSMNLPSPSINRAG